MFPWETWLKCKIKSKHFNWIKIVLLQFLKMQQRVFFAGNRAHFRSVLCKAKHCPDLLLYYGSRDRAFSVMSRPQAAVWTTIKLT